MPPGIVAGFALDRHGVLGEYRRGVEQRAMVLAAIEAVAQADPIGLARGFDPDVATQATTGKSVHAASPEQ
jgi:hypothetical protein